MLHIIKHIDIEGPGTLGDFLKSQGVDWRLIDLGANDALPHPSRVSALVVLGGPMNVDEEARYSFLGPEIAFIRQMLALKVPYLGICLGSQLLAKAAGAAVVTSPVKEIGWYHVRLTDAGRKDPLFAGFDDADPIYHWHGDMFQLPRESALLATGQGCPHQALRVGANAYGLQFHVEVTDVSIREWCAEYVARDLPGRPEHARAMQEDYKRYRVRFDANAKVLYGNFLKIAAGVHA